jgi:hypothetical protein
VNIVDFDELAKTWLGQAMYTVGRHVSDSASHCGIYAKPIANTDVWDTLAVRISKKYLQTYLRVNIRTTYLLTYLTYVVAL